MSPVAEKRGIRCLTLMQPWATAVVRGLKDVENRTSITSYRGILAIHAGLRWSDRGAEHPLIRPVIDQWTMPTGAVIGVVTVAGCHLAEPGCCASPWALDAYGGRVVRAHLELADAQALPEPVPAVGKLGYWYLTPAQERAVLAQVPSAVTA